jgi:hypothetical protein
LNLSRSGWRFCSNGPWWQHGCRTHIHPDGIVFTNRGASRRGGPNRLSGGFVVRDRRLPKSLQGAAQHDRWDGVDHQPAIKLYSHPAVFHTHDLHVAKQNEEQFASDSSGLSREATQLCLSILKATSIDGVLHTARSFDNAGKAKSFLYDS